MVVGCVGGGAVILTMAAYYLYVVQPAYNSAPKTRDVGNVPVIAPATPIVAPVAPLGYISDPW